MKHSILISLFVALMLTSIAFGQGISIDGPKNAGVGELCVFNLTSNEAIADWQIVPQADFYVDTAKRTMVFSTPRAGNYTIIAATILDGNPLVLTHACSYGVNPSPNPQPEPNPQPDPQPEPPKTLKEWVTQNIPENGRKDTKNLADCYDSVASSLERGTIRSVDAGFASLRNTSQTRVNAKTWNSFFEGLEPQVNEKLGTGNAKDLAGIFRQIASGLRGDVSKTTDTMTKTTTSRQVTDVYCPTGNCPVR